MFGKGDKDDHVMDENEVFLQQIPGYQRKYHANKQ